MRKKENNNSRVEKYVNVLNKPKYINVCVWGMSTPYHACITISL